MNTNAYDALRAPYKSATLRKLGIAAAAMVLGMALLVTGIGLIIALAAFFYLMMEGVRSITLSSLRKQSIKALKASGCLEEAMSDAEHAVKMTVDEKCFAVSDKYFYLPHGAVYPIADVLWIYPFRQTVRYLFIPIARLNWFNICLTKNRRILAFYGKVKNIEAFSSLMKLVFDRQPKLLFGYNAENEARYKSYISSEQ